MDSLRFFDGRAIAIATKHGKEAVIAPRLSEALGLRCVNSDQLDTDTLGTFSGEVERRLNPLETARLKCSLAMEITGTELAIASEGSFGAHPSIPFIPAHEELLVLIDKKNAWEFVVRRLETKTNYSQILLQSYDELDGFLTQAQFPSHAIIIKKSADDPTDCVKGVHDERALRETIHRFMQRYGQCSLETDMRAMHNPTRMIVIDALTLELVQQIQSACPVCNTPGFRLTDIKRGLLCSNCGLPTRSVKSEVYRCQFCQHTEQRAPSHGLKMEDPMYCDFCNP
ncbi:MAG: DUF6671 family protein [Aquirufa sp.]